MGRSKLPVFISLISLLVATGSVITLFSVRGAVSKDRSRVKATSMLDDAPGVHTRCHSIPPRSTIVRPRSLTST